MGIVRLSSMLQGRDSTSVANKASGIAYHPMKMKLGKEKRKKAVVPSRLFLEL